MTMQVHRQNWESEQLGLDAISLSASTTQSTPVPVNSAVAVIWHFRHTNVTGALTITCSLQYRRFGETTWSTVDAAFVAGGVWTLDGDSLSKAVTGTTGWSWSPPPMGDEWQLADITAAGAAAGDLLDISCEVLLPC